jgi:hypothetical protein
MVTIEEWKMRQTIGMHKSPSEKLEIIRLVEG